MKVYDLIVVGAGPAGLIAAKTAGENGLNVALLEMKHNIAEVKRACAQMLLVFNEYMFGERMKFNSRNQRLCFPINGFSIKYEGPYHNLYSQHLYSLDGHLVAMGSCEEGRKKGEEGRLVVVHDKAKLLQGLLEEAKENSVEVFSGINVTDIKKSNEGVTVIGNNRVFKGIFAIGADGCNSRLAEKLGFNQERKFYGTFLVRGMEMEGVELPYPDAASFIIGGRGTAGVFFICPRAIAGEYVVLALGLEPKVDLNDALEYLIKESVFSSWFKKAKSLRGTSAVENCYSPIEEPFRDNVLLVGDAAWCQEAEIMGSLMCGWKAAQVITLALLDNKVNREGILSYLDWWKRSYLDQYDHILYMRNLVMPYVFERDDIKYLFSLLKETQTATMNAYRFPVLLGEALGKFMPKIEAEKPGIIPKLQRYSTTPIEEILRALEE